MLIDTNVTIAYKCTSCGSFEFFNISLFTLLDKEDCSLLCRCKNSSVTIKQEGKSRFLMNIPCIGCGNKHTYLLTKKNILLGKPVVFNCPETGMQICFAGKDEAVRKRVDSLEEEFDELIDMYGYESCFNNTQVMFDMLNRIHDVALKGNLYCECGSVNVEMALLPDCILLRCGKCGCNKKIPAAKNKDLKEILTKDEIFITEDVFRSNRKSNENSRTKHSYDKFVK